MHCPTDAEIGAKISAVFAAIKDEDISAVNLVPEITSPISNGFAKTIDHTLLKPDATEEMIEKLCGEAKKYGFKSCCVNGSWVKRVSTNLANTGIDTCGVIGFPLGAGAPEAKAFETTLAIRHGATEIDMVLNLSHVKSRSYPLLYHDISSVVTAAHPVPVKVIIETVFLTDEEKVAACYVAAKAGAAFVKTSTGFLGGGATREDVRLMWKAVEGEGVRDVEGERGKVRVKASGGVRSFDKCLEMLRAGAERIGTSSGVQIMQDAAPQGEGY
ncbi:hypothetical protein BDZ91DRAFT_720174 [Kalaharituber pfeilii]|nr:hypothetical protein BDZ91DRAFT_720174 [Kalaharituber pfeilii]